VVLEVECIDRLYLNVDQQRLQYRSGLRGSSSNIEVPGTRRRR